MEKGKKTRVLYLYAGPRREFYENWHKRLVPDTQLLGLNYMEKLGIEASFLEWPIAEWLRKISFNLVHLPYIFAIRNYDVVFLNAGLPLVFLAKHVLRFKRPRFAIYNTYLTNALKRHPHGLLNYINRKAIAQIDAVICTAQSQADFLINEGFDRTKILFQPIGIDSKRFLEETIRNPKPPEYIASVGRDLGRDYKTLFEAAEGLSVKVKVATKPQAVEGLKIPKNVEVVFNLGYEEMPNFYQRAYFAVVPLRDFEEAAGSDTSGQYGYLEPMASRKAVIATNKDTVHDYITDGAEGLLVPPGNAKALRTAIEKLLVDESLRNRLAISAERKVAEKFTSERFASALAEIFKKISNTSYRN